MPYLGECGEQSVAEHGLIQPWVWRIRCGTGIDRGGRAVPRGRSAHSRCNGHDRRDHDPMFHLALLRSLSLALGRVTAKAGAPADLFIGYGRRTTPLPNKGYSARGGPLSVLAAQQIEVIQPHACHPGLEFASRRNKQEIEGYSVQACLVIIGVDKGARAAPWHSFSLASWRKAADPGLGAAKRYSLCRFRKPPRRTGNSLRVFGRAPQRCRGCLAE